ncbi:MAG: lamin tail domain-containing protein, partial [Flavobacteriales bacterium]
ALNYLGSDSTDYQDYYTLQNFKTTNPWDNLVKVCDELNNTPLAQLEDSVGKYMNTDRVLWTLAAEVAFADDDSYIHKGKNDYSLYYEPESGWLTTHEIDGNSVLTTSNLNWSAFYHETDANYPLMHRLFAVPALRQRYLAHLRTMITDCMDPTVVGDLLDSYMAMVDTIVLNDPKKLMTYAQFTAGVTGLENNVTTRRNNLLANPEVAQQAPVITNVEHDVNDGLNASPADGEAVDVRATVTSSNGISGVTLYWSNRQTGIFSKVAMLDDGAHNDGASGDGVYGGQIPAQSGGTLVRYYVQAAGNNTAKSVRYAPPGAEHDVFFYQHKFVPAPTTGVVINEVMADNVSTAMDENAQYEDWIELHNNTGQSVQLGLWFISDSPFEPYKWRMPVGTQIPANGYLIIWCDEDEGQGDLHTNYKLSNGGERILLFNPDSLLVDETTFGDLDPDEGWARIPNGTGPFQQQWPTFAAHNGFVGVEEATEASGLSFYPNPADHSVVLVTEDQENVQVLDATARQVWSGTVNGQRTISTGTWAEGTYMVRIGDRAQQLVILH